MKIRLTSTFKKDYQQLPEDIQKKVEKQIRMLNANPRYPSLHTKHIRGTIGIWEAGVDYQYRMTFQIEADTLILRRVGRHDIIETP